MIKIQEKAKCCGCYACYNKCPTDAIEMLQDEKGFYYPKVNKEKCIDCGLCNQVCPISNKIKIENEPKAFAAYHKNEEIRKNSSSGGIFTALAEKILEQKGVVFGAKFDQNFNVIHDYAENQQQLEQFRGSKYVQSRINNTFKKAEEFLENGRKVLFTGTPCQIEGLKKYLKKEYENLYTQDLICHGVPSEKVHHQYLQYIEKQNHDKIAKMQHRCKIYGWRHWSVKIKFQNVKNIHNLHSKDLYMQAFLKNTSLRDSCYECVFKKKNRISDITLADFWGIENVLPDLDDDKGTSLVIVNSAKGLALLEKIQDTILVRPVDFEKAIHYNKNMVQSEKPDKNREKFFENLDNMKFDELIKKYTFHRNIVQKRIIPNEKSAEENHKKFMK